MSKVGKLSIRNLGLGASKWTVMTGCSGWHCGHHVHETLQEPRNPVLLWEGGLEDMSVPTLGGCQG